MTKEAKATALKNKLDNAYASKDHTHDEYLTSVTVEKQTTAESGYAATYVVKQDNTQVGSKINIPKDFLVKSAELKTSTANNSPETGFSSGDKYIDFVVNATDGTGTDSHIYLNVKDLVDIYTADETTLTLSNNNQFSIKSVPSHTHNYLTSSDISGKIDTAGTGLSKSGTTLNHSNSINARTTAALKKYKYDAQGHITEESDISASDLPSHTHSINDVKTGTFTDLQTLINNATAPSGQIPTIILDKDYKYDSSTDSSLTSGITIGKNITIYGNGHIIDGNNTTRAFFVNSSYTVNLNDLILQNNQAIGNYVYGGAIYANSATVNINNTTLQNNKGASRSGAIYAGSNSQVNITESTLINNTSGSNGGAIYAYKANINITESTLINNTSGSNGGAIYIDDSPINITNSIIKNNTATNYANIYCKTATTVYNCDINNISTTCYNVTNKPYLTDHQSLKTINNESIIGSGNITIQGGGEVGTFTDLQTLITNASEDTIVLNKDYKYNSTTDSALSSGIAIPNDIITIIGNGHIIDGNNYARAFIDEAGYTWELNDLKIQNCTNANCSYGHDEGGAIYNAGTLTVTNTTFNSNTAITSGGAIHATSSATVNINNSIFTHNTAENYGGGAISIWDSQVNINNTTFNKNTTIDGGAILAEEESQVNINNTNITQNNAYNRGGAIYANSSNISINYTNMDNNNTETVDGGAIYAYDSGVIIISSQFTNNSAARNGGAIFADDNSQINIKESTIKNNIAESYSNISCENATTVYNCIINNINTTCYNVTKKKYATEDLIGQAITYINQ